MAAPDEPRDDAESPEQTPADAPEEVKADAAAADGSSEHFHAARLGDDVGDRPRKDAPDPKEAAEPDDVIHQPEDVSPDSSEDLPGKTQRVDAEGDEAPIDAEDTQKKRAALVYNPTKVEPETLRARVAELAAAADWAEPLFYETTVDDLGDDATRAALDEKVDAVLVAGGDGTVRAVAEALTSTGVPLTIVPSGTGNLLARNLNLPLADPDAMIRATFEGYFLSIDTGLARIRRADGEVEEHGFSVMAGIGLDAAMIQNTRDDLKKQVGWVAYVVSGVKALRFPGTKVTITVDDGEPRTFRARTVVIGNVGYLQAGLPLLPEARIDDGELDVVVIAPRRFFGWVSIAARVITRRKRTNDRLDRFTGRRVHVKAGGPTPMQLDGDPVEDGSEITAEVRPGVLLVRVPVATSVQKA